MGISTFKHFPFPILRFFFFFFFFTVKSLSVTQRFAQENAFKKSKNSSAFISQQYRLKLKIFEIWNVNSAAWNADGYHQN